MLQHSYCLQTNFNPHTRSNFEIQTPSPTVQFPWLPALTLLGVPAVVIFLWVFKHTLFGGISFGWTTLAELVLPLGACIFATVVFLVPNPMHALLSLLAVFFMTVLFYLAAGIAFVGLVFLIVYVGAVAVLFLFVIMLLNVKSLTSKDVLVQHLTQWLAIIAAAVLVQQLYFRAFTALSHILLGWSTQVSSLELTNAEAVLFYIRFEAADINRLIGLYTVHSPALLVTTGFLLVSLLGAIILATVTTERATALADIREYGTTVVSGASGVVLLFLLPTNFDSLELLLVICTTTISFMSMYTPGSLRSRAVFRPLHDRADGVPTVVRKNKLRVILPKIVTIRTAGRFTLWGRYKLAGGDAVAIKKVQKYLKTLAAPKKAPLLQRVRRKVIKYFTAEDPMPSHWPGSTEPEGFMPLFRDERSISCQTRQAFLAYARVSSAVKPAIEKWNAHELLLYSHNPIRRARWLWRWRAERATSLLRARKVFTAVSPRRKNLFIEKDWPVWKWKTYLLATPVSVFNLGLIGYLRYLYSARIFPFLYYWTWRARAFFGIWLLLLFFIPLILVPFPWFLDDYWVLLPQLQALHHDVYCFVEQHTIFTLDSPWFIKELVTLLLLYPAAAFNIAFRNTGGVLVLSAIYAYETVLLLGSDLARTELHDSTCNSLRIKVEKYRGKIARIRAAAELKARRRHPDRGRTDLPLVVTVLTAGLPMPSTAAEACPVSSNKLWELLAAYADSIRIPVNWDQYRWDFYVESGVGRLTALSLSLIWITILYSLSSLFVVLNYSRVYKNRSRPSCVVPVILLLVAIYLWVCLYPQMDFNSAVGELTGMRVHYAGLGLALKMVLWLSFMFWAPYAFARFYWIKHYKQFAYGNVHWLRLFVNYFYKHGPIVDEKDTEMYKVLRNTSIDELREQRAAGLKAEQAYQFSWTGWERPVRRTKDKNYFDPEPNPTCKPRRARSHPYNTSPFTGKKPGWPRYGQARRPMPSKVTFMGMFYPTAILFINLPLTDLTDFVVPFSILMTYFLPPLNLISSLTNLGLYDLSNPTPRPYTNMLKCFDAIATYRFPSFHFEAPHALTSFLPEIMLAVMITYLIAVVALELADNRPPKVLAIECWRAACWGLVFIALLYCIQLLGSIQSSPVANGYLYISKGLTVSKLFVTLTSLFILHLSENYIREHTRHVLEFSIIILLGVLLLLILVSANNLMLVFFSLAGFSLNLYILILYDGADAASREASLKYFYLSTLSSGFILFGILLIYITVGDATYYAVRVYMSTAVDENAGAVMSTAVLFILIGFFFKLSAFPGHLWAVEVYEGSPLPIMAFFILPVKVAIFITFMRLLSTGLLDFSHIWLPAVTAAALGSLLWGAFAATQERKTTRFLGYASINQIGFLLLGLIADTDDALRSAFFYLILYAIMTGGFLLVFTQLRKESGATFVALSDFRGLGKTENLVCWNLAVFLFSMAGIPPLAGFFGKYYLLSSLMEKGLFAPVVIGLAVSLITAYYYLRIIKTFWFEEDIAVKPSVLLLSSEQRTLLSVLEAALWVAAVFAPWLLPALTDTIATLAVCADSSVRTVEYCALALIVDENLTVTTCDPAGL